jgi:Tol biopolymer transport system component
VLNWMVHGEGNATRIWRANIDGSDLEPVSPPEGGTLWGCTPDGKWLYYSDQTRGGLHRLSINGGEAEPVPGGDPANSLVFSGAISPDGKTVALFTSLLNAESKTYSNRIVVANAASGVRNLDMDPGLNAHFNSQGPPGSGGFHFSPDGKSLALVVGEAGVDNIWMLPLDGSKPRKLTNFTSQSIQDFRWSADGKDLAVARFSNVSDAVLLHDTGNTH